MKRILILSCLIGFVFGDMESGSFEFDGFERDFLVFVPTDFELNAPVVLNLHGYESDAAFNVQYLNMNDVADTAGFLVVYPNAINGIWNSGIGDSPNWPAPDVDDVAFLSALIDTLQVHYEIDTNRVYSCGFSNGGLMSFRLALELGDRIQKVASVVGVVTPTIAAAANSASPISVLCILGTADPVVPFEGGESGLYSGPETVDFWVEHNQCISPVDSLLLPDLDRRDGCTATLFSYSGGTDGTQVIYYRIENGGHKWPSGFWYTFGGAMNFDIHASMEIWNFFNTDSYEIHGVWAHDLWMNTVFAEAGTGTLSIGAALTNTDDHGYTAYAVVFDANSSVVDSVELFDDGEHDDGAAGDGIAGAYLAAPQAESFFFVQASTIDMETEDYLGPHDYVSFTTIGPLVQVGYQIVNDDYPNPGDRYRFHLDILNQSDSITVPNVSVQLRTIDSLVVAVVTRKIVGQLAPGQVDDARYIAVDIAEFEPTDTLSLSVGVDIYSNNTLYWVDTLWLTIRPVGLDEGSNMWPSEYALYQNYPNPFNPTTTISYKLPEQSLVKLAVFDIRGQEVINLQNEVGQPGNYEVQWNGTNTTGNQVSTGVYFCRLEAGDYSKTIKMVYLR